VRRNGYPKILPAPIQDGLDATLRRTGKLAFKAPRAESRPDSARLRIRLKTLQVESTVTNSNAVSVFPQSVH
jgi:hypothetical protein